MEVVTYKAKKEEKAKAIHGKARSKNRHTQKQQRKNTQRAYMVG